MLFNVLCNLTKTEHRRVNIATWNMQGGNATTDVKWQTGVLNLMQVAENWRPDFMCLQECGARPPSAKLAGSIPFAGPGGVAQAVDLYTFGGSTSRPLYYVAYHEWDVAGGRVNTAIVGRGAPPAAGDVTLVWTAVGPSWRPALGVRQAMGGVATFVFSFHAISPGGPDAGQMAAAIAAAAGATPWYIGADWNREPGSFVLPAGSVVCPPDGPTHPVRAPVKKYDYLVRSGAAAVVGTRVSLICSDHYPVAFVF